MKIMIEHVEQPEGKVVSDDRFKVCKSSNAKNVKMAASTSSALQNVAFALLSRCPDCNSLKKKLP